MINPGEKRFYEFMMEMSGSFFTFLFQAMQQADHENLAKLALGFPEETEAVRRFQTEDGYYEDLAERYNSYIESNR